MTKSRISMVVAAAGLLMVGLLAAALFSPGDDEPVEEQTSDAEKIKPVDVTPVKSSNVLGYDVVTPPLNSDPLPAPVKPEPKPEPKVEPKPAATGGVVEHKIQPGDMVSKLAVQYGCKVEDIYKMNEGLDASNAHKLRVGQTIKIPSGPGGAEAVKAAETKPKGDWFPARTVTAEAGDTAYSLAIEYYGNMYLFRKIVDANPELAWGDRLKGGEQVSLPEYGTAPAQASKPKEEKPAGETVERSSLIPPRK
ncbi:MAG: LysM peptidoglycan-binding domain-containing protein [Planctomycetes bacterium]|nr:LysM peptidoglycan-binding domain-containing protein [Planctomycetota bacterium]